MTYPPRLRRAAFCLAALTISFTGGGCGPREEAPSAAEAPPAAPAPNTSKTAASAETVNLATLNDRLEGFSSLVEEPSAWTPPGVGTGGAENTNTNPETSRVPKREAQPAAASPRPKRTGPVFSLPTANDGLLTNKPDAFYMFVDRYTPEGAVQVWQGGSYGYVRNPRTTAQGEVFTKFHEGVDIAPVQRDAAGEPLDMVLAIADGTVVYCTPNAASNYGNYMVVEHPCGEDHGNFYSLYAHLRRMDVPAGTPVKRGQAIALMGHTGEGIDRRRSHVHLELCLLLSDRFNEFYAKYYKLGNPNSNFHGHNLIGIDVAAFLLAAHKEPGLTPADFLKASGQPYYKVRVPNKGVELPIAHRYPWLRRPGDPAASWEIAYNTAGVPLSITPDKTPCSVPAISWVKPYAGYHGWNTRNHLAGSGNNATLAAEGAKYQALVIGDF